MREILFKAKRKGTGEWVEGYYTKTRLGNSSSASDVIFVPWKENRNENWGWIKVMPETICQYTGLTDKNGKKIWENDVCHYHDTHNDICVIRFGEYKNNHVSRHMGFYTDWQTFDYMFRQDLGFWANEREIEVIGNIFDNSELLEGGVKNEKD